MNFCLILLIFSHRDFYSLSESCIVFVWFSFFLLVSHFSSYLFLSFQFSFSFIVFLYHFSSILLLFLNLPISSILFCNYFSSYLFNSLSLTYSVLSFSYILHFCASLSLHLSIRTYQKTKISIFHFLSRSRESDHLLFYNNQRKATPCSSQFPNRHELLSRSVLSKNQCDQMARSFAQYLAIYSNKNLPNSINDLPNRVQILYKPSLKWPKGFKMLSKWQYFD